MSYIPLLLIYLSEFILISLSKLFNVKTALRIVDQIPSSLAQTFCCWNSQYSCPGTRFDSLVSWTCTSGLYWTCCQTVPRHRQDDSQCDGQKSGDVAWAGHVQAPHQGGALHQDRDCWTPGWWRVGGGGTRRSQRVFV